MKRWCKYFANLFLDLILTLSINQHQGIFINITVDEKKSWRISKKRLSEISPFWNYFQLTLHRCRWSKEPRATSTSWGIFQSILICVLENWLKRIITFSGCETSGDEFGAPTSEKIKIFFFLLTDPTIPMFFFSKTNKCLFEICTYHVFWKFTSFLPYLYHLFD